MAVDKEEKDKIIAPAPKLQVNNEGDIYSPNRATRRRKPQRASQSIMGYIHVPENAYTKATHKIKKERLKNAPTKQQRERAIAKARKARKASYTQIS